MKEREFDVAVIGAGAAGLAAATVLAKAGRSTLVIDREDFAGGILRQCIHSGFGLKYYKEELTGPEYAERAVDGAQAAGASFALGCTVTALKPLEDGTFRLTLMSAAEGVEAVHAKAVVLAMGCRERNRGNLATPGTRPAGVFTAGTAQKLLNLEGRLPGRTAVIVGSGDIGLIMARRLQWCGMEVKGVVEIMPHPSGLARNVAQCLDDFGIPLWLEHSVTRIVGRDRVEGVEVTPLVQGVPDTARTFTVACDTLLFSVGLVPETELARPAGVALNPATGGAFVDANYETSVPGIFSAGNVLHVHDLVDFVSEEAARAGKNAAAFVKGEIPQGGPEIRLTGKNGVRYTVPQSIRFAAMPEEVTVRFRVGEPFYSRYLSCYVDGERIAHRKKQIMAPGEMEQFTVRRSQLSENTREIVFCVEEE